MKKKWLIILLLSLVISVITSPLRGGYISIGNLSGIFLSSLFGFILYFILTFFLLKKYDVYLMPVLIFLAMLVGGGIYQIPMRIIDFDGTAGTFLDYLIHTFGIVCGYICYKILKKYLWVSGLLFFICGVWLAIAGNNMWLNKLNFGTFTGKIEDNVVYDLTFQNEKGETLQLKDFKGKYLLLDCWYTRCGVCYEGFPKMQKIYDKYKGDSLISVYSMHSRLTSENESLKTGLNILKNEGYTFPCLSIDIESPILRQLGVYYYPTVLVFNPQSQLIFRGDIFDVERFLYKIKK